MTRGQLEAKYKSKQIANTIADAKLADPQLVESLVKWHPDAVGNEARL